MNPESILQIGEIIKLAVNGISVILLVALVPAIGGTLFFTIRHLIENPKG